MGRPRYAEGDATARDRLAEAFWSQLEATPFEQMTARGVAAAAGVNHNTFYRHFESLEDMAARLFDEVTLAEVPPLLVSAFSKGTLAEAAGGVRPDPVALHRAVLFARSGSALLTGLVRERLTSRWLDAAGVRAEDLSTAQRVDVDIVFGGIVAAMGDPRVEPDAAFIAHALSRPLGQAMLATIVRLKDTPSASAPRSGHLSSNAFT